MMANKVQGIDYGTTLANLRASSLKLRGDLPEKNELLNQFHPDYQADARVELPIGPNQDNCCHPDLAKLLISRPLIDDYDLSGAGHLNTGVLVISGGGAGATTTLSATEASAHVIMANKLRVGDSNTMMAEGGIQATVGTEDSLQQHFDDTIKGDHNAGKKELVAQMVTNAPVAIRWLIGLGMTFDLAKDADSNGTLSCKHAGGTTAPHILSYRDLTDLEMVRVLREAVEFNESIIQLNRHPTIELLSDEHGRCVGAVLYDLERHSLVLVHAKAMVLTADDSEHLHLQDFTTSNHYGVTAGGLVMACRIDAKLRDVDSFQYHLTGIAHPPYSADVLISEAVRSAGTKLVNGLGERFVDKLQPCDVAAAAILREYHEGRGVVRDGQVGVSLDTPCLIANGLDVLNRLVTLGRVAHKCGIDFAVEPMMVHPTLHYQNGDVEINSDGATCMEGLCCASEITGGIHDRNRLMGNALPNIISFGHRAGKAAANYGLPLKKICGGVGHVRDLQREMTRIGLTSDIRAPVLYPDYGKFDLCEHAGLQEQQS